MKILIVSDSHGETGAIRQAIAAEKPERVFFLGDVVRDIRRVEAGNPGLLVDAVVGNCDSYGGEEGPEELERTVGGVKFYLTHGHRYRVKLGTGLLYRAGREAGAEVICYGHTHRAESRQREGIWVVNPGTIGGVGSPATYAVAEVESGKVRVTIRRAEGRGQ